MKKILILMTLVLTLSLGVQASGQKHRHTPQAEQVDSVVAYSDTTGTDTVVKTHSRKVTITTRTSPWSTRTTTYDLDDEDDFPGFFSTVMKNMNHGIAGMFFVLAMILILFVLAPVAIIIALFYFINKNRKQKMKLAFQGRGAPVSGLAEQICSLDGIERVAVEGSDLPSGWGRFWDGIAACAPNSQRGGTKIYHLPQPVMDTPAKTMQTRQLGGGAEVPDRMKSPDDIAPLFACIMAFTAATMVSKEKQKMYESAYASGSTLVFC